MSNTQTAGTAEGTMITENAWPVHKHQDMTRVPFAQRTLPCQSWIPRPARKEENTPPQTRQWLAMGLQVGPRAMLNAGCA